MQDEEDEENEDDSFALMQARMWHPEAVSADTQHTARAQRMHDIISMLVQIYGSKDLFINEYRRACWPSPFNPSRSGGRSRTHFWRLLLCPRQAPPPSYRQWMLASGMGIQFRPLYSSDICYKERAEPSTCCGAQGDAGGAPAGQAQF